MSRHAKAEDISAANITPIRGLTMYFKVVTLLTAMNRCGGVFSYSWCLSLKCRASVSLTPGSVLGSREQSWSLPIGVLLAGDARRDIIAASQMGSAK